MTYRPHPISGFPEHLPEIRMVEQGMLDRIRVTFESYGFAPIETPSVEELEVLLAKGETDKEIYTIERLQADEATGAEARLGLHYDLTVPFARYVAQHFNELVFPFKRYQMQRVWRGERPQAGRFREFLQCDIDVIGIDNLALTFDAELAAVAMEALKAIGVEGVTLHLSNRKILQGYLAGMGCSDPTGAIRWLDKVEKLPPAELVRGLAQCFPGVTSEAAANLAVVFSQHVSSGTAFVEHVRDSGVENPILAEGVAELKQVIEELSHLGISNVVANLSIARGFDYYTGTVYEGRFDDAPGFGSVVAGGRYDDLAGAFINKKLPGVGISIGFSRLFSKLMQENKIKSERKSPADLLVVLPLAERRAAALATAQTLRGRGFKVETYHAPQKLARQLSYAEKKGIPFVWFPPFEDGNPHEIKDMASGVQVPADPEIWAALMLDEATLALIEDAQHVEITSALARQLIASIDLTSLELDDTPEKIAALCRAAVTPGGPVAAVCVYPGFVRQARTALAGTGVKVATVIDFPDGDSDPLEVMRQTEEALREGAEEIDLVFPYRRFLSDLPPPASKNVRAVRDVGGYDIRLKVILESGAYPDQERLAAAADVAIQSGADFLKTLTGKIATGATPEAAAVILSRIAASGLPVGFKASGGIREPATAALYLTLAELILGQGWANPANFRIGASSLLPKLLELAQIPSPAPGGGRGLG